MPQGRSKIGSRVESVAPLLMDLTPAGIARGVPEDRRQVEFERLRAINLYLAEELARLKEREVETQRLADRDGLTGLYNRRRMQELLEQSIIEALAARHSVGLLFIDLNGFKAINDEYGHAAGDKILITVATRIAARVRVADFVARYGGDEFVVILPNAPDAAAVACVAETIRERIALPYWICGSEQHLTAAVGESMYPRDGESAEVLMHRADQAMYRLKTHLARPLVSLGTAPHQPPSRRRNDRLKRRTGGTQ